jgi:tetratricopeptide (TPR) repeat protein
MQATERLPVDPLAFYYLADAAERRAHFAIARNALRDYLAVLNEEPDSRRSAQLFTRMGDLSMRVTDYPSAVSYYERAASVLTPDLDVLVRFAEARWRTGQSGTARTMVEKVLEKDPEHAAARSLSRRIRHPA